MIVVLPEAAAGLPAVEDRIAGRYDRWVAELEPTLVNLWLPRWTTTSTLSLAETLGKMGMPLAFDSHQADFLGMADAEALAKLPGLPRLFIAAVLQKSFIETNETGTEAASVTAIGMEQEVSADHRTKAGGVPRRSSVPLPDPRNGDRRDPVHRPRRRPELTVLVR